MKTVRDFTRDTRGTSLILTALFMGAICVIVAVGANLGLAYLDKRKYQSASDVAALRLAESANPQVSALQAHLDLQGFDDDGVEARLVTGIYREDETIPHDERFEESEMNWNAVRVEITFPIQERIMGGAIQNDNSLSVHSTATLRRSASLWMGSRLLRLEGGLPAALLDSLVGYNGRITVADYEQLLDAELDLFHMLELIHTDLDLDVLTYNEVLESEVTLGAVTTAIRNSEVTSPIPVNLQPPGRIARRPLVLKDIIDLGRDGVLEVGQIPSDHSYLISAGELLFASAALANGDRQAEADLEVLGDFVAARVDIGDPGRFLHWDHAADGFDEMASSQVDIELDIGSGLNLINTSLQLGSATARIKDVQCDARRNVQSVTVEAETSPTTLTLNPLNLRDITIDLSGGDTVEVEFSSAEIAAGTTKTVSSGLGVNVNRTPLLYRPLVILVNDILEELGIYVGEADVRVTDASCRLPYLVD